MSVHIKMLLSVCLIIFIVLGTSTALHTRSVKANYLEALEWRFEALSSGIRGEIVNWVGQDRDPQTIFTTLRSTAFQCRAVYELNQDRALSHVSVLDGLGVIAAHNDREAQGGQIENPVVIEALERHESLIVRDGKIYRALIPIFSGEDYLGTVDIGFPTRLIDKKVQQLLVQSSVLLLLFLVVAFFAVSIPVYYLFTKPLRHLMQMGTQLAQGELDLERSSFSANRSAAFRKPSTKSDEIKALTEIFYDVVDYLREMAHVASRIAGGDLSREVQPRSEHDMLGTAFHQMSTYLTHMASIATTMASGDLRQQIHAPDEQDVLGTAFYEMDTLRQTVTRIMQEANQVRNASDSLSHISVQMTSDARRTSEKVRSVSSNSQHVSDRMELLSVAMGGMSMNIKEISRRVVDVTDVITTAVTIANGANETLADLEKRSQEIGNITELITTITQQTNLLALNATIEAARAGEAGRGFTVVAHEIKELSREIAESAKDITHKIDAMQLSASSVARAIAEVRQITNHVHEISQTITSSVEEQTATSHEISINIADASQKSYETSETIAEVADVTDNTMKRAVSIEQAAEELALLADQLQQFVGAFKV